MKMNAMKKRKRRECVTRRHPYMHILVLLFPVCQRVSNSIPIAVAGSMNEVPVRKGCYDSYGPPCENLRPYLEIRGGAENNKDWSASRATSKQRDFNNDDNNNHFHKVFRKGPVRNDTSADIDYRSKYSRMPEHLSTARHGRLEEDIGEVGENELHNNYSNQRTQQWQAEIEYKGANAGRIEKGVVNTKSISMNRVRYPDGTQFSTQRQGDFTTPNRGPKLEKQIHPSQEEHHMSEVSNRMNMRDNRQRSSKGHNLSTKWQHKTVPLPPPHQRISMHHSETEPRTAKQVHHSQEDYHLSDVPQRMNRNWERHRSEVNNLSTKWRRGTVLPPPPQDPPDINHSVIKTRTIPTVPHVRITPHTKKTHRYEGRRGLFPPPPPQPPIKSNPKFLASNKSQIVRPSTITLEKDGKGMPSESSNYANFRNASASTATRSDINAERHLSPIHKFDGEVKRKEFGLSNEETPVIQHIERAEIKNKDVEGYEIHSSQENSDGESKEEASMLDQLSSNVQIRSQGMHTSSHRGWWSTLLRRDNLVLGKRLNQCTQNDDSTDMDFQPGSPQSTPPLQSRRDDTTSPLNALVKDRRILNVTDVHIESCIKLEVDDGNNQIRDMIIPVKRSCINSVLSLLDTLDNRHIVDERTISVLLMNSKISFLPSDLVQNISRKLVSSRGNKKDSERRSFFKSENPSKPGNTFGVQAQPEAEGQSASKLSKKMSRKFEMELRLKDVIYYILWATVLVLKILWRGLNFVFMMIAKILLERIKEKYNRKRKRMAGLNAVRLSLSLVDDQSIESAFSEMSGVVQCLANLTQRSVKESTDDDMKGICRLQKPYKVIIAEPVVHDIQASTNMVSKVFKIIQPPSQIDEKKRMLTRNIKPRKTILSLKTADVGERDLIDSEFEQLLSELSRDPEIEIEENTDYDDLEYPEIFENEIDHNTPQFEGYNIEFEEELYDEFDEEYYTYDFEPYE